MKWAAAKTSAGLSLLFVVVYGACNWITAQRSDVGTWYLEWERYIPFIPVMIVPYMSIDLFFVAGPFLCQSREELDTLTKRIVFAIVVAGACFLLIPLRFAFDRPSTEGWTGTLFNLLHGFDKPHNLFPSLHITLRTILADLYARHAKGALRAASRVWFSFIGFSTILTWQHHLVDIAGGFVLAAVCFYLFREEPTAAAAGRNLRIGGYYAAGAILIAALAFSAWPWTAVLLWPAAALGIVACGYLWFGPPVYRKSRGRLSLSSLLLLAPFLAGQWLSLYYYRRRCTPWSEVTPRVWIGARLTEREAEEARKRGVTAVLDLTAEFDETQAFSGVAYRNLQILDLTAPSPQQIQHALEFIEEHARLGIVFIHCKIGYSRSGVIAGTYLLASGVAGTVDEAVARLRHTRPSIILRPEVKPTLDKYFVPRHVAVVPSLV